MNSTEFNRIADTQSTLAADELQARFTAFGAAGGRDADGQWRYLLRALAELGPRELQQRQQVIRRLLRDNGVAYHDLGGSVARPWLLDPVPLAIASADWRPLERGLQQRAELWHCLLADLYGPQRMLRQGLLPAELVFADPHFLRPCMDLPLPPGRRRLPLYAADLAQGADGTVYVVGERAQSLNGAGYALENRIVLSRVFPSLFRDARVHRLALFFRTLRNTLQALAWPRDDSVRIVLLTPGPESPAYFEHAYLARYLGYPLVQGDDLTVRDGRVFLKTLERLQPVDVVLHGLDDADCDPLELRLDSRFGVAGLLQAIRQRQVAVADPLGSRALENPGLSAYLPALCRALLGEDLLLPAPPAYWCGDGRSRDHVLGRLERLVVRDVFTPDEIIDGRGLDAGARDAVKAAIRARPYRFVAREPLTLATAPVLIEGALQAQPVVLRSFLVAAEDDYVVMPGGLGRIGGDSESRPGAAPGGGISKDTWVLASEPIQPLSLLPSGGPVPVAALQDAELPSRVAENMFWLGRYTERSESIIRLLRVLLLEALEPDADDGGDNRGRLRGLLRALTWLTETFPGFAGEGGEERLAAPDQELTGLLFDPARSGGLAFTLYAMLGAARAVRDRLSPDIWRVFTTVDEGLRQLQAAHGRSWQNLGADTGFLNQALAQLNQLLTACAAFTGLAQDSMTHGQGWRFMMVGRRLERALQLQRLLRPTLTLPQPDMLEPLLNICDSLMTYRARYHSWPQDEAVLELLLLDETNPRALGYQLRHLHHDIERLPVQSPQRPYRRREQRLALDVLTRLRLAELPVLTATDNGFRGGLDQLLQQFNERLTELGEALTDSYFRHADLPQQLVNYRGEG